MPKKADPPDIITLKSLKFHGYHGYYDEERKEGNHFETDIIAKGDFKQSIRQDHLNKTFNYELAESTARKVFDGEPEKLIESLCFKIGENLFNASPAITELVVSVRKMNPPVNSPAEYAEITMTWNR